MYEHLWSTGPRRFLGVFSAVLAILFVQGCSDPTTSTTRPNCVGPQCTPDEGHQDVSSDLLFPDTPVSDAVDGSSGELPWDTADDCLGPVNSCGGCATLPGVRGEACGPCVDGLWVCNGPDDLVCAGPSDPIAFYTDGDRDGFGNPLIPVVERCEAPSDYYTTNDLDCDDTRPSVNPDADEVCNGLNDDCDDETDEPPEDSEGCTDACCDDGVVCENGRCLIVCDGTRCGRDFGHCCGDGEICYAETCVDDDDGCEFNEDCPVGEFCEQTLGICITRDVIPECIFRPPTGDFDPRLDCRWTTAGLTVTPNRNDVVATPVVMNLTDDNDDGETDPNDIPDIAFLSYDMEGDGCCNQAATLRIVSGLCNDDGTMNTLASITSPAMTNDTGIATADIIGDDGIPEIVVVGYYGSKPQGTIAFERVEDDGSVWRAAWENETYPTWNVHTRGGPAINIADIDADGDAEVIIGNVVLNGQNGDLVWDGLAENPDSTVGIGNNAFLGPSSAVADINLDGFLEIMAGNTLYDHTGHELWTFAYSTNNSPCGGTLSCDGFSAIANFDDDDFGEVAIIRRGEVFILEHNGDLLWRQEIPTKSGAPCSYNESGPPTVADFDGDGRAEVGTAAADFYVVADMDCDPDEGSVPEECNSRGILWRTSNHDCSSRVTASSVFDFEGDEAAEVVYADEQNFRIFDGRTGAILFDDDTHGSHTRLEMPVIADVDNDGNAEIVIPENGSGGGRAGIDVWVDRDDNWVRTRRVWNQHGYSITNITEDGAVPREPRVNWLDPRLNNWRQNVQPDGLFDAPDLQLIELVVEVRLCAFELRLTVLNAGALGVPPGTPILITVEHPELGSTSATVTTETRLFPGDREEIEVVVAAPVRVEDETTFTVSVSIDPEETINECDEDNNGDQVDVTYFCMDKD